MNRSNHRRRWRDKSDAAITALRAAKRSLRHADAAINAAILVLSGVTPPTPPSGDVIQVKPGDDLRTLIDAAADGTIFEIDPAYSASIGDYSIDKPVTLRSAGVLPTGRVPVDASLPTLTDAAIIFGAPGITMQGLRVRGKGTTALTLDDRAVLDRCVVTGPGDGGSQQRGVYANAEDITIKGSSIYGIFDDVDAQAVLSTRFTKRLHISDCLLEASGENFMAGGDDGDSADETPEYILIEASTLSKPPEWQTQAGVSCKNLFELKNAKHVALRNCVLNYSWADGQTGYAVVLTVRNQYGRAPWSTIEDVLIENNQIQHCGAGFQLLGRDNNHESQVMRRVTIRGNTIADVSTGWCEGAAMAAGLQFFISGGPDAVTIEDNDTSIEPGYNKAAIGFDQAQYPITNLVIRRCRMFEGDYGITGQADGAIGVDQINGHAPGYVWDDVSIVRGSSGRWINYPDGTTLIE